MASFRRRRQHRRSAITLPFRKTRRNNNSRSASDQTVLLGLPLRASFFAFLSRRFCLRSLAATFLVLLPPLSLVPIGPSRPATEADPHCLTPSPLGPRLAPERPGPTIRVHDDGTGMPETQRHAIFDASVRPSRPPRSRWTWSFPYPRTLTLLPASPSDEYATTSLQAG